MKVYEVTFRVIVDADDDDDAEGQAREFVMNGSFLPVSVKVIDDVPSLTTLKGEAG